MHTWTLRVALALGVVALAACDDSSSDPAAGGVDGAGGADGDIDTGPTLGGMQDAAVDAAPWMPPDAGVDLDGGGGSTGGGDGGADLPDIGPQPDAAPRAPECTAPPSAPGPVELDMSPRCRENRGAPLRIRDLLDSRCDDYEPLNDGLPGREVEIEGAIVTGIYGRELSIQDPEGGANSALVVYNRPWRPLDDVSIGSRVRVRGSLYDFFGNAQISLPDRDALEVIGQGEPPAPLVIADPARIADDGDLAEVLESVLVEIVGAQVIATNPDCPRDFGEFLVDGGLRIDDAAPYDYEASNGDVFLRLTGTLHYGFDHYKLRPRSNDDLDVVACGGRPDKCEGEECPVEIDAEETGELIITEIQNNPLGDDRNREYIEIHNPGPGNVDMTGWRIESCAGQVKALDGRLDGDRFYVLGRSEDERENGGFDADDDMGDLFLPNGFGSLLIWNAQDQLVDQVRYEPTDPWPDRGAGESLELQNPAADNRDGAAWTHGRDEYGEGGSGSPGRAYRR
jgi:hypothetical protein